MGKITNTQIDRLGERLKKGNVEEADLRLLDEYRRSFTNAYASTVNIIKGKLVLNPTGRPAKSTTSIIDKLKRESIRLTQMQDIAGCRIIVDDIIEQDRVVEEVMKCFESVRVVDRREAPSYGYRAVHLIIKYAGNNIEVQVRTKNQHLWAELSEKISDFEGTIIKYGGGDSKIVNFLSEISEIIANDERLEKELGSGRYEHEIDDELKNQIKKLREKVNKGRKRTTSIIENLLKYIAKLEDLDVFLD